MKEQGELRGHMFYLYVLDCCDICTRCLSVMSFNWLDVTESDSNETSIS